jgi:hypothetical protein
LDISGIFIEIIDLEVKYIYINIVYCTGQSQQHADTILYNIKLHPQQRVGIHLVSLLLINFDRTWTFIM